jgi:hypothetical protein
MISKGYDVQSTGIDLQTWKEIAVPIFIGQAVLDVISQKT